MPSLDRSVIARLPAFVGLPGEYLDGIRLRLVSSTPEGFGSGLAARVGQPLRSAALGHIRIVQTSPEVTRAPAKSTKTSCSGSPSPRVSTSIPRRRWLPSTAWRCHGRTAPGRNCRRASLIRGERVPDDRLASERHADPGDGNVGGTGRAAHLPRILRPLQQSGRKTGNGIEIDFPHHPSGHR